jgi:hypothetical protein
MTDIISKVREHYSATNLTKSDQQAAKRCPTVD